MNSFDIRSAYKTLHDKQDEIENLAAEVENSYDNADPAQMRADLETFTQAMGEYNLGDKVMMAAAKNNFSIEQQVLQELKQ